MRRVFMTLSLVLAGLLSSPPIDVAAQEGRAACEGYCGTVAIGCYVLVGIFIGRDKCDAMYEGCVDGCIAALQVEE